MKNINNNTVELIPLDSIIMIQSNGKSCIIHSITAKHQVNYQLCQLEEDLEEFGFIRINKFNLVNYKHILAVLHTENVIVKLSDYTDLVVSPNYLHNLENMILEFSVSA